MNESIKKGRTMRENPDGTWSPATPIGWQEEHNWFQRLVLWIRGIEHCNDREGQRRKRFSRVGKQR